MVLVITILQRRTKKENNMYFHFIVAVEILEHFFLFSFFFFLFLYFLFFIFPRPNIIGESAHENL